MTEDTTRRTRRRRTLPGKCWVEECRNRPAIDTPANICAGHITAIINEAHDREAQLHLDACIWPKCREYRHNPDTKMCSTHTAIVMYQGHKDMAASARYYSLRGLDADLAEQERLDEATAERAARRKQLATIYVIQGGINIKVGYTTQPLQDRLRAYPPNHSLLVHFPGSRDTETHIKRKFAHLRTHGNEWLAHAPEVTEWVDRMVAEHGTPDPTLTCGPAKYRVPRPHSQPSALRPRDYRGKTA